MCGIQNKTPRSLTRRRQDFTTSIEKVSGPESLVAIETSREVQMENLRIEHVAEDVAVYASYFLDVSNVAFLQSQLVARNPDFEYALIDASAILSRNHLLAAIFSAATAMVDGSLKTPNVHSEIVYSLSPASNVCDPHDSIPALTNAMSRLPRLTDGLVSHRTPVTSSSSRCFRGKAGRPPPRYKSTYESMFLGSQSHSPRRTSKREQTWAS